MTAKQIEIEGVDTTGWKYVGRAGVCDFFRAERGIVVAVSDQDTRDTEETARAHMAYQNTLVREVGEPAAVIALIDRSMSQDAGARSVYQKELREALSAGVALVGGTVLGRTIASFFLGIRKPRVPTRMFATFAEALIWCREMLAERAAHAKSPQADMMDSAPEKLAGSLSSLSGLETFVEVLGRFAAGDFSARVPRREDRTVEDALAFGVNALGEELAAAFSELAHERDYAAGIVASMNDSLVVLSPQGTVQSINPACAELLGYGPDELSGKPAALLFAEEEEEAFRGTRLEEVVRTGAARDLDLAFRAKDGQSVPLSVNAAALRDPGGALLGVVGVGRDLRERNRLLREVDDARAFSQAVVENLPSAVVVLDSEGRPVSGNPMARALFPGSDGDDREGRSLRAFLERPEVGRAVRKVLEGGGPVAHLEVEISGGDGKSPQSDGGSRILQVAAVALKIAEEEATAGRRRVPGPVRRELPGGPAVVLLVNDITEPKTLTQKLERSYGELRRTQAQLVQTGKLAALGELAGGVAHELNNPLTGVLGLSKLVLEALDEPELGGSPKQATLKEHVRRIAEGASRSRTIVQNLLAFARQSAATRKALRIETVMDATLGLLSAQLRTARIQIEGPTVEPGLPTIHGNPTELQQVFTNIMLNAWQAMPEGGRLRIGCLRSGPDAIEVTIEDTGCGIAPENLDRVFEPFFTTKPPGKGTGLGLSLAWRIVEDHGGTISLESQVGRGTVAQVRLPAAGAARPRKEMQDAR